MIMQTYQAYIPSHLRNYVRGKQTRPPHSEAELEDAILNRYYRLIRSLVGRGVLEETTHYFTCRDTKQTRVHRSLDSDPYVYLGIKKLMPDNYILCSMRTNYIKSYDGTVVAQLALQMVGRYGDVKSFKLLNGPVKECADYDEKNTYQLQLSYACTAAIRRDEIELFNLIRACSIHDSEHMIIYAQSTVCIRHFLRTLNDVTRNGLPRGKSTWFDAICRRRRIDLLHEYVHGYPPWALRTAVETGFIELLNELYQREAILDISWVLTNVSVYAMKHETLMRVMEWAHNNRIQYLNVEVISKTIRLPFPKLIGWYLEHNIISEAVVINILKGVEMIANSCGFPSVEFDKWKECVEMLVKAGIPMPKVPVIRTRDRRFGEAVRGMGGIRVRVIRD